RPHHRGLPWQIWNEALGRKGMETRSSACRRVVEEIVDCRLCRSRRRQREEIGRAAGRRRAGAQPESFPWRGPPLANRPANAATKMANLMKTHTKITTDTKPICECLTFCPSWTLSKT